MASNGVGSAGRNGGEFCRPKRRPCWELATGFIRAGVSIRGRTRIPHGEGSDGLHTLPSRRTHGSADHGRGAKGPATEQDRAGLFNTLVAYTGAYRVEGDKWITTVDVSANPGWVGTDQTRSFRITGNRLQEVTAWVARPDDRMARAVITYERVK